MKVYREKAKSKVKRYFRRGGSQRYVNHFQRTYSLPLERTSVSTVHNKFPGVFLFFMLIIFGVFSIQLLSTVISPTVIQDAVSKTSTMLSELSKKTTITITFPEMPKLPAVKLPEFKSPKMELPKLPSLPTITLPQLSFQKVIAGMMYVISQAVRILNPTPLIHLIMSISPQIVGTFNSESTNVIHVINPLPYYTILFDSSLFITEQISKIMLIIMQILVTDVMQIIPLLNPLPLFHTISTITWVGGNLLVQAIAAVVRVIGIIGRGLFFIFRVLLTALVQTTTIAIRFVGQAIMFVGNLFYIGTTRTIQSLLFISYQTVQLFTFIMQTAWNALYQVGTFFITVTFHAIIITVQTVSQTTLLISRWFYQITLSILHLLDPRPFFFRVGSVISYRIFTTERAITRTATDIWNISSPPFVNLWKILSWAVEKDINDLKPTSDVQQTQALQVYPTPVVTQYTYPTQ